MSAAVKEEFRIDITRQAVEAYNPTRVIGKNLSAKLREHFYKVREAFRRDIDEIPIASKAVRLRLLNQMVFDSMDNKAYREAAELLEQAAKEVGGVYIGRGGLIVNDKAHEQGEAEPRDPGADRLAELGESFAKGLRVIKGDGGK